MTLPFRRRHHDDEASHDRARALISASFLEPLAEGDTFWLDGHLGRCPECRVEREALVADRALLRGLRDRMPEPPRDLWARTAAAIESQRRPAGRAVAGPRRFPLGAMSVALVVLVVVAMAILQNGAIPPLPGGATFSPGVARSSTQPGATPLAIEAARVAWVRAAEDGSIALIFAEVDHACPHADPACAPLADSSPAPLPLTAPPQAVVLSPSSDQIAVVGSAAETSVSVVIVRVPTQGPVVTSSPTSTPDTRPSGPPTTTEPSATASPLATGSTEPGSGLVIARDVTVVGAVAFSASGEWVAFSARPRDGATGPDLYVWHAGDAEARRITADGATFFSAWYGDRILASTVMGAPGAEASASPSAVSPAASPSAVSPAESAGAETGAVASAASTNASPDAGSPLPSSRPGAPIATDEAHPVSFLLDPVSGIATPLAAGDVWMPTIDPTGRFIAYWSGTLVPADSTETPPAAAVAVAAWRPAMGHLVLDGWSAALVVPASPVGSTAAPDAEPTTEAGTLEPSPAATTSGDPTTGPSLAPMVGPAGTPIELAAGPIADFDTHFDPTGTRLAVWVLDASGASAGRLWLVVLDAAAGSTNPTLNPMGAPGVPALHGFTIESGRLGWIAPAGQDGQPSSVQVLAWKGDEFGQAQSFPGGGRLQIVR